MRVFRRQRRLARRAASAPGHQFKFDPTVNAPWANEGDEEEFEPPDAAAGLCRSALRRFRSRTERSRLQRPDVITGDQVNNSGFSNLGCTTPQNETTIAVNPTNPNNLIAGANDYRVCCDFTGLNDATGWAYYSFDGGKTWGNVQVPGLTAETGATGSMKKFDSAGDPVMAFGSDGDRLLREHCLQPGQLRSPASWSAARRTAARPGVRRTSSPTRTPVTSFTTRSGSRPGRTGRSWSHGRGSTTAQRRRVPRIADRGRILEGRRQDVESVRAHRCPINAHPFDQGSQVQYGPDGALYVAYEATSPKFGYTTDAMVVARSTDNGQTFQTKELARVYDDLGLLSGLRGTADTDGQHFRLNSYPSMSVDPVTGEICDRLDRSAGLRELWHRSDLLHRHTSNQVKLDPWHVGRNPLRAGRAGHASRRRTRSSRRSRAYNDQLAISYYTREYGIASTDTVCNLQTNTDPSRFRRSDVRNRLPRLRGERRRDQVSRRRSG